MATQAPFKSVSNYEMVISGKPLLKTVVVDVNNTN